MDAPPFRRHEVLRREDGEEMRVLSVHPPQGKRPAWLVTVLTAEGRAWLIEASALVEGGWSRTATEDA